MQRRAVSLFENFDMARAWCDVRPSPLAYSDCVSLEEECHELGEDSGLGSRMLICLFKNDKSYLKRIKKRYRSITILTRFFLILFKFAEIDG